MSVARAAIASAPGRVCWYGDNADWIRGPAMLSALDPFRVFVLVEPTNAHGLLVRSVNVEAEASLFLPSSDDPIYSTAWDGYIRSTVTVLAKRWRVRCTGLQITANTTFPIGAGLSSSAALCVATVHAMADYFGIPAAPTEIAKLAYQAEHYELKIPCGQMDQYTVSLGGMVYVNCATEPPCEMQAFSIADDLVLVVADTGVKKHTAAVIAHLKDRIRAGDPSIELYISICQRAINYARESLAGNLADPGKLGEWMNLCQAGIRDYMKVSIPQIDHLCTVALNNQAYGAKLSGSGGGGCMFALCDKASAAAVARAMQETGARVYLATVSSTGVRSESEQAWQAALSQTYVSG
jgi:galactokinase